MLKSKLKVLICDDEKGVRESLRMILDQDYELAFAANGQEAVDQAEKEQPNLVILDIKMPMVNGMEALGQIKKRWPQIKALIITGYESVDVAVHAAQLGADQYLTKPFTKDKVQEQVKKLLGLPQ